MVGVALVTHLHDEGVLNTGALTGANHFIEGLGGGGGELVVTHQCHRLYRVGHTVSLTVVGYARNGSLGELVLVLT